MQKSNRRFAMSGATFFLTGLSFSGCGGGGSGNSKPSASSAVVPRARTKIIRSTSSTTFSRVDANHVTFTGASTEFAPGTVLVSDQLGGILSQVTQVETVGGKTQLTLTPSTLEDAFSSIKVNEKTRLTVADVSRSIAAARQNARNAGLKQSVWDRASVKQAAAGLTLKLPFVLEDLDKNLATTEDQLVLELEMDFDISPYANYDVRWLKSDIWRVGAEIREIKTSLSLTYKGAPKRDSNLARQLAGIKIGKELDLFPPIAVPIGASGFAFQVDMAALMSAQFDWGIRPQLSMRFEGEIGGEQTETGRRAIHNLKSNLGFTQAADNNTWIDTKMTVEGGVKLGVGVTFLKTATAKVEGNFVDQATGSLVTYPAAFNVSCQPLLRGAVVFEAKVLGRSVGAVEIPFGEVKLGAPAASSLSIAGSAGVTISKLPKSWRSPGSRLLAGWTRRGGLS